MKKEIVIILIMFFLFFLPINSMSADDAVLIITTSPYDNTLIGRGNTVTFTFNVDYSLDSEDTGELGLWVQGITPCFEVLADQQGEIVPVSKGNGNETVSSTALIVCNDGREVTKIKVGVTLKPEGAMGGPNDFVYYNTGPHVTEQNFTWPMFLPAMIGTP